MDHYVKGESRVVEENTPANVASDESAVHMMVKDGTKIRNVMGFAMKKMKEPDVKQLTWNASGPAVSKAISCAEIMKRKIKGLYQNTKIYFKRVEDYWEPQTDGLDRLCVTKNIPAVTILLSKEELDPSEPGYQPPGSFEAFWKKSIIDERKAKSEQRKQGARSGKRFSNEPSQFAPPSMARKPKKRKDGGPSGSGKGPGKSSEGRKFSGAEGKQLKTAKNDSVKAQDRKKREKDSAGGNEDAGDSTSPISDDSKMDTT